MNEDTIRQVVVTAPGVVEIRRSPAPQPAAGQVLVRMRLVGICGSDVHAFHGRHPFVPLPYHPGHEVVGTVEAVGEGVDIPRGTRVVVEPILACGRCKYCLDGRYNLCATMTFFGCTAPDGGLADLFVLPADRVVAIPDRLSDLHAALIEPLSTPVHAVRLAGPDLTGKTVALPAKRELAAQLGADSVHDAAGADVVDAIRADLGTSADVVFDCVSVQATIDQAIAIALKGGTVVVIGVPAAPVTVPLPHIQDLQVRIQGSATYTRDDFAGAITMLAAGLVNPDDFITARYPLTRVADAFDAAATGRHVKVVVTADGEVTTRPGHRRDHRRAGDRLDG
jgi:threonine dehydrogenase-like Zn-dependent dehydrogenase